MAAFPDKFAKEIFRLALLLAMVCHLHLSTAAGATLQLKTGEKTIQAEVASSPASRDYGLMNRHSLPADNGMLFVFPNEQRHCMWMRNTPIPLSVAFIDQKGIIINIANMQPGTYDYYCATEPVPYALEMNLGWFLESKVLPGTAISGLEKAPPGR
ncbi:MAG TPA: DUF192 domain-containing protein [Desulfuromonadaceae bacterium]